MRSPERSAALRHRGVGHPPADKTWSQEIALNAKARSRLVRPHRVRAEFGYAREAQHAYTNNPTYKVCRGTIPPNGGKALTRLTKLFPANRRTSVRPRPLSLRYAGKASMAPGFAATGRLGSTASLSLAFDQSGRGRTLRSHDVVKPRRPRQRRDPVDDIGADGWRGERALG